MSASTPNQPNPWIYIETFKVYQSGRMNVLHGISLLCTCMHYENHVKPYTSEYSVVPTQNLRTSGQDMSS